MPIVELVDLLLADARVDACCPVRLAGALGFEVRRVPPILVGGADAAHVRLGQRDVLLASRRAPLRLSVARAVCIGWLARAGVPERDRVPVAEAMALELLSRVEAPVSTVKRAG